MDTSSWMVSIPCAVRLSPSRVVSESDDQALIGTPMIDKLTKTGVPMGWSVFNLRILEWVVVRTVGLLGVGGRCEKEVVPR